jgi:hypothetical protein
VEAHVGAAACHSPGELQTQLQQQRNLAGVSLTEVPDSPPAAIAAAAAAAVAAATAAAASPGSPALDVLASSMQRIAGYLEEFLSERSPTRAAAAQQQQQQSPSTRAFAAAATPAAQVAPHATEQTAVTSSAVVANAGHAAAGGQVQRAPWSPAASAAKARMLASSAGSAARMTTAATRYEHQQSQGPAAQPQHRHVAGPDDAEAVGATSAARLNDGSQAAGWIHPSSIQETLSPAAPQEQQQQCFEAASTGPAEAAAAPASSSQLGSLQALAARVAGSTVLGRATAAAPDGKLEQQQQQQQQQGVAAGWQAEPSLVDMPGSPSSLLPQGSPNRAASQQQRLLLDATLHTADTQLGSRGAAGRQQQQQRTAKHWHLDSLSSSDADEDWQQGAEQEHFSFRLQLPSLQQAALQLGPPPSSMRQHRAGGMFGSRGGASAKCIVAAAEVKLLQPERGEPAGCIQDVHRHPSV